jgi:polar amino acid transport system substrate-binding protein
MSAFLTRREAIAWAGVAALSSSAACSTAPAVPPSVVSAFAPTGRLRASINLGNPILANKDASGQPVGVSIDLANALGKELGVPVELVVTDAAAKSVDAVANGRADIGFFAVDPLRAAGVRFTAPYVLIEGAYVVRQGSPLKDNAEVDRPGMRVMAARGSAYDLYLTRELKSAQLLRVVTSQEVVQAFLAQNADVAAGVKQQMEADAARLGGLRLLPGRFMVIEQAMGVQAGRGEAVEGYLKDFVERAKAGGLVADSLKRYGIQGASVAPVAK